MIQQNVTVADNTCNGYVILESMAPDKGISR